MNKLKKREINQVIDKSWIYVHDSDPKWSALTKTDQNST